MDLRADTSRAGGRRNGLLSALATELQLGDAAIEVWKGDAIAAAESQNNQVRACLLISLGELFV